MLRWGLPIYPAGTSSTPDSLASSESFARFSEEARRQAGHALECLASPIGSRQIERGDDRGRGHGTGSDWRHLLLDHPSRTWRDSATWLSIGCETIKKSVASGAFESLPCAAASGKV